ncbi:MAG: hypothetical protein U1F31_03120 [Steroidobacteraceae bacterium]
MSGTGEFELSLLSQTPPPRLDLPPLEAPPQVNVVTTLEETVAATLLVAASAQRLMSIYTPNLEPDLYDQSPFLDIVKRFVLARSFAKVRVLTADGSRLNRDVHRFVAMSRRLTSYIDIRVLGEDIPKPFPAYIIADDRAILYRANATLWDGIADLDNPAVARMHLADFDAQWIAHVPDYGYRAARR